MPFTHFEAELPTSAIPTYSWFCRAGSQMDFYRSKQSQQHTILSHSPHEFLLQCLREGKALFGRLRAGKCGMSESWLNRNILQTQRFVFSMIHVSRVDNHISFASGTTGTKAIYIRLILKIVSQKTKPNLCLRLCCSWAKLCIFNRIFLPFIFICVLSMQL